MNKRKLAIVILWILLILLGVFYLFKKAAEVGIKSDPY